MTGRAAGTDEALRQGPAQTPAQASTQAPASSEFRFELGLAVSLWRRDLMRLRKQPSRWAGVVLQPLIFWFVIGSGLNDHFVVEGQDAGYLYYFFPGIVVMTTLFTSMFASIAVIEDRQSGYLQGVLVAPGSNLALVLGKSAGVTSLAMIQTAILILLAPLAGFPLGGFAWGTLLITLFFGTLAMSAANLAVAWRMSSTQAYHAIMSVVLIPLWIVSGAMFPAGQGWLGTVVRFNPITWVVEGIRQGLGSDVAGVTSSTATQLTGVLLFAVVGLLLAVRSVSKRKL